MTNLLSQDTLKINMIEVSTLEDLMQWINEEPLLSKEDIISSIKLTINNHSKAVVTSNA